MNKAVHTLEKEMKILQHENKELKNIILQKNQEKTNLAWEAHDDIQQVIDENNQLQIEKMI